MGELAGEPVAQQRPELAQLEEVVLRVAQHRGGAGHHRVRVDQVGGRVGGAAVLAVVAVLVRRTAVRAHALDVAVRQEHFLFGIEQLLDAAPGDVAGVAQARVDQRRQLAVLFRMSGVVLVERHAERGEIRLVAFADAGDEGLGRHARLFRGQHDRRAVRVVGADVDHLVAAHPLRAHPDVRLDVAQQVAHVQRAIGIGQRVGDEQATTHGAYSGDDCALCHADHGRIARGQGFRQCLGARSCAVLAPLRETWRRCSRLPVYACLFIFMRI